MIIFSLVAMTGLEKCCITSAYLQWQCHSGERPMARGPLVLHFIRVMPLSNFGVLYGQAFNAGHSVLQTHF